MFDKAVLAAAALLASVGTASAVTLETFEFGASAGPYQPVKVFTGSEGSTVTVTAKTVSEDGAALADVASPGIGQFAVLGLGVRESTGDNSHTVDGAGKNDLLELKFGSDVKIVSASFTYAGRYAENIANILNVGTAGFSFFADDDADGSVAGDMIFNSQDIATNLAGAGNYNFGLDIFSSTFAFAAIYDELFCTLFNPVSGKCRFGTLFQDSFKLKSIVVEHAVPSTVPVPGALPLFLSALAMGGYAARRKARKAA